MTTEERIKQIPACIECGAVQFARYGHFPECSQFIADLDRLKPDIPHQPAARGGGDVWEYVETKYSAEIRLGRFTLRPHWIGLAEANEIEMLRNQLRKLVQHQSLVAERERLIQVMSELLVEAEISCVLWQQSRGFVGTVDDAYRKNLMPAAYSRVRYLLANISQKGPSE